MRNELNQVTGKLLAAYDQLAAGNRVRNVDEFHDYGRAYGVDTVALVDQAHVGLNRRSADMAARRAARLRR